jgi:hypothetical protein
MCRWMNLRDRQYESRVPTRCGCRGSKSKDGFILSLVPAPVCESGPWACCGSIPSAWHYVSFVKHHCRPTCGLPRGSYRRTTAIKRAFSSQPESSLWRRNDRTRCLCGIRRKVDRPPRSLRVGDLSSRRHCLWISRSSDGDYFLTGTDARADR